MANKRHVQLVAVTPEGDFVVMQILKVEMADDLVRIYVTYEAMADTMKQKPKISGPIPQIEESPKHGPGTGCKCTACETWEA